MFNEKMDYIELNKFRKSREENIIENRNIESAIKDLINLKIELKEKIIASENEMNLINELMDKHKEIKKNNSYEGRCEEAIIANFKLFVAEVIRLTSKDYNMRNKYIKEVVEEMNYINDKDVNAQKLIEFKFDYGKAARIIESKFLLKDFDDDYFLITNDMTLLYSKSRPMVSLQYGSIKNFIYTCIVAIEADINDGLTYCIGHRYYINMYYGLYRYNKEVENREELKKHILNNAYKLLSKQYRKFLWNTFFSSLAYVYPEVFEGFIENEYKLQKTTLSLIDFGRVDPINGFTKDEEEVLKRFKKEKNTILSPKPKKLKALDDFRGDLVAISHNSKELLNSFSEEINNFSSELIYEEEQSKLNLLKELCSNYNKGFWSSIKIYGDDSILDYLEKYSEVIKSYEELISMVEEKEIIGLGQACYDIALSYEYLRNEELAKNYFEKAALYLTGALPENYFEQPVDDIDNSSINYIKNAYANFEIGNLEGFYNAIIDDTFIEDNEEIIEELDLNEYDYTIVGEVSIKEFIKLTKIVIKVEEAKGQAVAESKILLNIIKELWDYKKTHDESKKEKIKKYIDKLYNLISNHISYMEYYPLCLSLYSCIEKL